MEFRKIKVNEVQVIRKERFREDLGDLAGMVETIKKGLCIQPISVDENLVLIAGERRLQAHKMAGLSDITARVWPGLSEQQKLELQHIENEQRKDLKPSEKAKAYKAIKASEPSSQGKRAELKVHDSGDKSKDEGDLTCGHLATSSKTPTKQEKMRDRAAKKANFSSTQEARRAEKVLDHSPPEIMSAVDAGIVTVSDAAKVADEPAERQLVALQRVRDGLSKTLKGALAEPKDSTKAKAATAAARNHKAESEDSEPEVDCCGRVIPANLSQVRADSRALADHARALAGLLSLLGDMKMDGFRCAHLDLQTANHCKNLKHALEASVFHCVCVYCEGKRKDCKVCKGAGWCNKSTWESAPREKKKVG